MPQWPSATGLHPFCGKQSKAANSQRSPAVTRHKVTVARCCSSTPISLAQRGCAGVQKGFVLQLRLRRQQVADDVGQKVLRSMMHAVVPPATRHVRAAAQTRLHTPTHARAPTCCPSPAAPRSKRRRPQPAPPACPSPPRDPALAVTQTHSCTHTHLHSHTFTPTHSRMQPKPTATCQRKRCQAHLLAGKHEGRGAALVAHVERLQCWC